MLLIGGTAKCDPTSHQRKGVNEVEYHLTTTAVVVR